MDTATIIKELEYIQKLTQMSPMTPCEEDSPAFRVGYAEAKLKNAHDNISSLIARIKAAESYRRSKEVKTNDAV